MTKKILISLAICFVMMTKLFAQQDISKFIVIGNKTGMNSVSLIELQKIFKGKYTNWRNGEAVTIVLPSPKTNNAEFVANIIYQTSVPSMQKYWLSLVFQGRFSPPIFTDSDLETLQQVQKFSGAIGIVDKDATGIPRSLIIQVTP